LSPGTLPGFVHDVLGITQPHHSQPKCQRG